MIARIYSLLFLALMVVGFIYQESYMQMTLSELNTNLDTDKFPVEVFSMTPLQLHQYKDGELVAELSANEGRLVTTGKLTALGEVQMRVVDEEADPGFRLATLNTERLVALSSRPGGVAFNVWGEDTKFERIEIPGAAEFKLRGHTLTGRVFNFDASKMTLVTNEPVRMVGPRRTLDARGLELDFRDRGFKFVGPVKGTESPPPQTRRVRSESSPASKPRRDSRRAN
ncbi:MAG: hypothetical protein RI932_2642 [Pseudomonadota bacterium]